MRAAVATAAAQDGLVWRFGAFGLGAALALAIGVGAARAEDGNVIVTHSITTFDEPSKYPADFPHLDYVNPDAPKGGEISIWTFGTFDTLNPYTEKGTPGALATIGYENMLTGTADEIGAAYCLLCSTMEYPKDKSWVIFNLRPEVKFSDGTPMTADDVKYTYELFQKEGLLSFRTVMNEFIAGAEVLDPHRIKYTFKPESTPRERIQMAGTLPVMSKAWFEKTGAKLDESRLDPGIGTGPYKIDSYEINTRVIAKRNPDYWGNDLPINKGRNNFDTIRVEYFADPSAAFEGFKSGAYTFRIENSSKQWATQYDFPAIQNGWAVKAELPNGNIARSQSFIFNLRREKFQDPRVREALGLVFNFEWSNQTLFYGLYSRVNSFWENSDLGAKGLPSPEELALLEPLRGQIPDSVFTDEVVMAPVSGEQQLDRKNLRKAAALLDEAGWPAGEDGKRRNAKGDVLTVEFLSDDPNFDRIINPYIENLIALGVDAKLTRVDDAQYSERTGPNRTNPADGFDFDVVTQSIPASQEPGAEMKQYLGSEGVNDVFNQMGLADPAVDSLIRTAMEADTREKLRTATSALDRVLRAKKLRVPQWFKPTYWMAYYDMYEHPEVLPPYDPGYLDFWWYNPEKGAALKAAGALK